MMKNKYLSIIAAAAAVLVAAACNKVSEEDNPNNKAPIPIQPEELVVSADGDGGSFSFSAPDYWFASSPDKWVIIDSYSGKPGSATVDFRLAKNTVAAERSTYITVNAKGHKGKVKVTQQAWPFSANDWTIFGTIGGSNWDTDFAMEDVDNKLVWEAKKVPYYATEEFKFRMFGSDVVMGLSGSLTDLESDTYAVKGSIVKDGGSISLPEYGYWDITLDLEGSTFYAVLAEGFPWSMIGAIWDTNWDQDIPMTDLGDQLVWEVKDVPYHTGEEFKFRMDGKDIVNLGIDGEFTEVEGALNTYKANLKLGGGNITLPAEGYWNLTLDVADNILTAVLAREFPKPDPNPLPSNWKAIWTNDGSHGEAAWDGLYRFGLEGTDGNNECVATIPEEDWNRIKTETVYVYLSGDNPQVRVTTGWWSANLTASDIQPGNELLADNGAGTWILTLKVAGSAIEGAIDVEHLLFTGSGFTVLGIYYEDASAGSHLAPVWVNDGSHGPAAWDGVYRFGLEGRDGNNECVATFPQEVWDRIKSETFYVKVSGENPQIRVTTGWWSTTWTGADIQPGNDLLADNGDGTWTLTVNLANDAAILELLDEQHLLFTGGGFIVEGIYLMEDGPAELVFWENDGSHGAAAWDGVYRFGLEGRDGNNECIATFPEAVWEKLKTGTFYLKLSGDNPQVRVTTGWWSTTWTGADIQPGNERLADNGDGTWTLTVDLTGDAAILELLDEQHLLFTGGGFTPLKLYCFE